jgi:S1-C subfamily serine protease
MEARKPRRRHLWLAALLLLTGLALMFSAGRVLTRDQRDGLPRMVKRVQPAVVTVMAYNVRGEALFQGTGFFMAPGDCFLTNYHVLAEAFRAEVVTAEGRCYAVRRVVAADPDWDLVAAAVVSPPEGIAGLNISRAVPEVGERVAVVGSPLGLEHTLSDGVVSAIRRVSGGHYLQISAPLSTGSSGSPVINMKGEVVGVASLQVIKGQNLNFAVPGSRALALQEKTLVMRTVSMSQATPGSRLGPLWGNLDRDRGLAGEMQDARPAAAYRHRQAKRFQPALAGAFSGLGRPLSP